MGDTQSPPLPQFANLTVEVRFSKEAHLALVEVGDFCRVVNKITDKFGPQLDRLPFLIKMASKYSEAGPFLNASTPEAAELAVQELHDRTKDNRIAQVKREVFREGKANLLEVIDRVQLLGELKGMCEEYGRKVQAATELVNSSRAKAFGPVLDSIKESIRQNHKQFMDRLSDLLMASLPTAEAKDMLVTLSEWWPAKPFEEPQVAKPAEPAALVAKISVTTPVPRSPEPEKLEETQQLMRDELLNPTGD